MIDITLLGTGGMMPLPYRALTSLMVRYNGKSLLIDTGEATQISIRRRGWSFNPIDMILITHFHADHISGLPGLLLAMGNADRTEPVTIIGPEGLNKIVRGLLVIAPRLPFKVECIEISENDECFDAIGMDCHAFRLEHSMPCYGYSLSLKRAGKFDPDAAKALQIPLPYWRRLQHGETITDEDRTYTPDMVMGEARKGLKVTYVTDTRPIPSIITAAEESDVFICEGMYGEADGDEKARDKKHMTMYDAAKLAKSANVGQLWLTHYSPSMVNPFEFSDKVKEIFPEAHICKDRRSITLNFEDEEPGSEETGEN